MKLQKDVQKGKEFRFKAESSVKNLKKFRLLDDWMKKNSALIFDVVVTKVKPFGIFFDLGELMLEGFLHISQLENDYFVFNASNNTLIGQSSHKIHSVGEVLKIRPLRIDLILLEASWELVLPKGERRRIKR